jgi:hypothetical protein
MGDVAVCVVLGGGPVRGGAQDSKRSCLTGRGCSHLVREEVGGQRSLWPTERLGPRWRVGAPRSCPAAGVERQHVHAVPLEQFNLGNNWFPITAGRPRATPYRLAGRLTNRFTTDRASATQLAHRRGGTGRRVLGPLARPITRMQPPRASASELALACAAHPPPRSALREKVTGNPEGHQII